MEDLTLEHMLDLLEDRVVRTSNGPYIAIEDLRQLQNDFKETRGQLEPKGTAKTFSGAKVALHQDPEFLAEFEPKDPKAPADAAVVKPVGREPHEDQGSTT